MAFPKSKVAEIASTYLEQCAFAPVTKEIVINAFDIIDNHDLQFFDSIIVSAAVKANCSILYSEDMSDGQIINNQLKIVNPFK